MKGAYPSIRAIVLCLALLFHWADVFAGSVNHPITPTTHNGRKWRIGYYQGGSYVNYPANLKAIVQGLVRLGWMDKAAVAGVASSTDARQVWMALSKVKSKYLRFVPEAFSSADWDNERRVQNRAMVIQQLKKREFDFMIAMGTWAGQDLANNLHSVPVMVVSCSDPVRSGIVQSAFDSGLRHVHARCAPNRYKWQVRLFHDIVGFKRLGIVYEDSVAGKSYAALADIEKVAARRDFQMVTCEAAWSGVPQQVRTQQIIECHQKLAPQIDALFMTVHGGVDLDRMDEILAPLTQYRIPTWSQRGPQEVRHGVLMSIARGDFKAVGIYHATIMAKIFNGAAPQDLNQIFEDPKKIAINLKTAKTIGFDLPGGLTKVADEIYQ